MSKRNSEKDGVLSKPKNIVHFLNINFPDNIRRFGYTCNFVERLVDGKTKRFLYIFGLANTLDQKDPENQENDIYIYDLEESKWLKNVKYRGDKPYYAFIFHSGVAFKEKLYYYGGYNGFDSGQSWMNFYSIDVRTHEWTKPPAYGDVRYGHIATVMNGKMLVHGGVALEPNTKGPIHHIVNFCDEFDFSSGEWSRNEKLTKGAPIERCFHSGSLIGDKLYIYGGYTKKKTYETLNDLWVLDNNKNWNQIQINGLPKSMCGSMFNVGNVLYFISPSEGTKKAYVLDLETNQSHQLVWNTVFYHDNPDEDVNVFSGSCNYISGQLYFIAGIEYPKLKKDIKTMQELIGCISTISCPKVDLGL